LTLFDSVLDDINLDWYLSGWLELDLALMMYAETDTFKENEMRTNFNC